MLPIAIDVMSGDHEPREYVAGALRALAEDPQLRATLVGDPQLIGALLATQPAAVRERATVAAASQVVTMEEKPREAIRHKKDSSMGVAIELVHAGAASDEANATQVDPTATKALRDLPGLCAIPFIDSPP